ncbi:MAG: hypothetical protein OXT67_08615 [Zetaproteobacteria bacterium]|nr:hypothetical protein [Zetaproteobacteria bacterium]
MKTIWNHLSKIFCCLVFLNPLSFVNASSVVQSMPKISTEDLLQLEDTFTKSADEFKSLDIRFKAEDRCECGHTFTFIDFINTAIKMGFHTKDFLLKNMFEPSNQHRNIRKPILCSQCGQRKMTRSFYSYRNWGCSDTD